MREVVKSSGETKQSVTYSAYGEPVVTPAPGEVELNVSRLYTGREYERETGDNYYRARFYNSSMATFLSPDPIGFGSKDANFYRYVKNHPIRYSDPFGLQSYPNASDCQQEALDSYWDDMSSGKESNKICEARLKIKETACRLRSLYDATGHLTEHEEKIDYRLNSIFPATGEEDYLDWNSSN